MIALDAVDDESVAVFLLSRGVWIGGSEVSDATI